MLRLKRDLCLFAALVLIISPTQNIMGQELFVHDGSTRQIGSEQDTSWGYLVGYSEALSEHSMWSITYLNEGHVTSHKRDGFSFQLWGRYNLFNRRLSLAVGAGPYLYYDTHIHPAEEFHDHHGVAGMVSASATVYTGKRLFLQARGNWVEAPHSSSTFTITAGVGYQLGVPSSVGPLTGYESSGAMSKRNEFTVSGGKTVFNSITDKDSEAAGIEYRRKLSKHVDISFGWLYEGDPISRTGPTAQIWVGRSFFGNRLNAAVGAGPYVTFESGERNDVQLSYLISFTAGVRIYSDWTFRSTWHRVGTPHSDRDTDVFLMGIGYRF